MSISKKRKRVTCLFIFIQSNIGLLHTNDGLIQQPEQKCFYFSGGKIEKKLLKLVSSGIFSDKGRSFFATFINIHGKPSVDLIMY
jgi:hypothetical protein